jgi:beta-barrel assembly-enhancing protease
MAESWRTRIRTLLVVLFVSAAGVLAISPTRYEVSFDALLDVWGDVFRDVDAVVRTVRITQTMEIEIGNDLHRQMQHQWSSGGVPEPLASYVSAVGARVAKGARRRSIPWAFHVVRSELFNAWAIPGGHVYITTTMLERLTSEAELAAILGHEIAHIDLYHCVNRAQDSAVLERLGLNSLAFLVGLAERLVTVGYSEVQEAEADRAGLLLAARAGYDPLAAFDTFRSLHEMDREEVSKVAGRGGPERELLRSLSRALRDYFQTHPRPLERLAALRELLERNASAWEGRVVYRGAGNHKDRVAWDKDARPTEQRNFSQKALEYLVVRSQLAHLLGRELETRHFVTQAITLYPEAKELEQLKPLIATAERPDAR